ncbi:MAG: HAMP domain-containing histidine kinase, partial [Actinomycetales bacterium]|nr:HAMP domain-containing histidine kinase [Actinomycetales bacterium]
DGVTEPDEAALTAALKQTERLGKLVTYLLDLSRLEAGAAALDVGEVRLEEFLGHVADGARLVRPDKNLTFAVKVAPPHLTIQADEQRLHQVFANLAQNAVRHSPRGEEITFEAYVMPGGVVVDVTDQGPGIAKGDRERVFDRFARGNNPAHTGQIPTGGTGLGLSIVRWAVTLHGGTVAVADTPSGCTMRVTLPPRPTTVVPA